MTVPAITVNEALAKKHPTIDVRSPGEFAKGHIPEAINIPLFSDEERAHIGTVYKQQSQEKAIALGYQYANPKLEQFIASARRVAPDGRATIHCWRGGMRSSSFAQHLADNGFKQVAIIEKGYKAYRNFVLGKFAEPYHLHVLGGYTGSGKTHILHELKSLGQQVIDLEGLAHHKGSSFGGIGQGGQPTVEQFENDLYQQLSRLDNQQPIWVEDESHNIGKVRIPMPFFKQMQEAKLFFVDIPKTVRAHHLVTEYAQCDSRELAAAIERIAKRLGGLNKQDALENLAKENYYEVALISLQYYDKFYLKGIEKRDKHQIVHLPLGSTHHKENASHLLKNDNHE